MPQELPSFDLIQSSAQINIDDNHCGATFITPNCCVYSTNDIFADQINNKKIKKMVLRKFHENILKYKDLTQYIDYAVDSLYLNGKPIACFVFFKKNICTWLENKKLFHEDYTVNDVGNDNNDCPPSKKKKKEKRKKYFIDKYEPEDELDKYGCLQYDAPFQVGSIENDEYDDHDVCLKCHYCNKCDSTECDYTNDNTLNENNVIMCDYFWLSHIVSQLEKKVDPTQFTLSETDFDPDELNGRKINRIHDFF